jgi:hypothetical protein
MVTATDEHLGLQRQQLHSELRWQSKMISRFCRFLVGAILLGTFFAGCGSPQFSPASRELMKPLQTAVSSKKLEWIDATETKVRAQYDRDNISWAELEALLAIIEESRSGHWSGAQRKLDALVDGQRATADDLARLRAGQSNQAAVEHRKLARQSRH